MALVGVCPSTACIYNETCQMVHAGHKSDKVVCIGGRNRGHGLS